MAVEFLKKFERITKKFDFYFTVHQCFSKGDHVGNFNDNWHYSVPNFGFGQNCNEHEIRGCSQAQASLDKVQVETIQLS